jgi:hypothetical protein
MQVAKTDPKGQTLGIELQKYDGALTENIASSETSTRCIHTKPLVSSLHNVKSISCSQEEVLYETEKMKIRDKIVWNNP